MREKTYKTPMGTIHYYVNDIQKDRDTVLFLPGLTADHRLFEKQIPYFEKNYNVFVWDAPGHAESRPFELTFDLQDKATWLDEILAIEHIENPILVGQSMGAYVGQAYQQYFPGKLKGFVSIDSAPLQKKFMTSFEIWCLKHTEGMYLMYPWKMLLRDGANGTAETEYGRANMKEMMMSYSHKEYAKLTGHGFAMLAKAIEADLPYKINCPAILICGENDKAGYTTKYNKMWHADTEIPIYWIKNAGHNSNADQAEEINDLIEEFIKTCIVS